MKRCMFMLLDDDFLVGYEAFIKSFLYHNSWFDLDIVVLDVGLSEFGRELVKYYYDKIVFETPQKENYETVEFGRTKPELQKTFYFLEAFRLYDYDRVVSIDVDMICQGDMSEVFESNAAISACQTYRAPMDMLGNDINSGLFVINRRYLNAETYRGLLEVAQKGYAMPDQKVINNYFKGLISHLPKRYNIEKRMLFSHKIRIPVSDWTVIHYVGQKPWHIQKRENEQGFQELEDIWREWYAKDFDNKMVKTA